MQITIELTQEQADALIDSGVENVQDHCTEAVIQCTRIPVEEYRKKRAEVILKTYEENPEIADVVTKFVSATEEVKTQIRDALSTVKVSPAEPLPVEEVVP